MKPLGEGSLTHFLICWMSLISSLFCCLPRRFFWWLQVTSRWPAFQCFCGSTVDSVRCCMLFGFYCSYYMGVKVFTNIREIWQKVNKNFLPSLRSEPRAVSGKLFRHSPHPITGTLVQSQPPVALLGEPGCEELELVRPSWAQASLSHFPIPSPRSWDANHWPAQEVRLSLISWLTLSSSFSILHLLISSPSSTLTSLKMQE